MSAQLIIRENKKSSHLKAGMSLPKFRQVCRNLGMIGLGASCAWAVFSDGDRIVAWKACSLSKSAERNFRSAFNNKGEKK